MEGLLSSIGHAGLMPARWLAGILHMSERMPILELTIGLFLLATCTSLSLILWIQFSQSKRLFDGVAAFVFVMAGLVGSLATILIGDIWLYALVLCIVIADIFWRVAGAQHFTKTMQRLATATFLSFLIATTGQATIQVLHNSWSDSTHTTQAQSTLTAAGVTLNQTEYNRLSKVADEMAALPAIATGSTSEQQQTLTTEAAVNEVSYGVVFNAAHVVLARVYPASMTGDTWPVLLSEDSHYAVAENGAPIIVVKHSISVDRTVVLGVVINQSLLQKKSLEPLFVMGEKGIIATNVANGALLDVLTSDSVNKRLVKDSGLQQAFSVAKNDHRYLVNTHVIGNGLSVGTIAEDTSAGTRMGMDITATLVLVGLVIVLSLFGHIRARGKDKI